MGTTWFKRLENRSYSLVKLLNIEDPNSRGHNVEVQAGSHIALDMKIPWAPLPGDFQSKHLELQIDGVTRYWIWQATKDDGDFIRFSTNATWQNPGTHVFGYAGSANNLLEVIGDHNLEGLAQFVLKERVLVVLDSHFETIPIHPKPLAPAHTFIKRLKNQTTRTLTISSTLTRQTLQVGPNDELSLDMEVPWALGPGGLFPFDANHLKIAIGGVNRFWVWQHDHPSEGDYVRVATSPNWVPLNNRVKGFAETGECPGDLVFTLDRTMIVAEDGITLEPNPLLLDQLLNIVTPFFRQSRLTATRPQDPLPVSVPKRSAAGFSVAGPVSDRYLNHEPRASSTYKETGKRYEYTLGTDGKVTAIHPNGTRTILDHARSFTQSRKGLDLATVPPFDLIAANGGRVFAKAVGTDDFYFATMDHSFITWDPNINGDTSIPGYYFKLDPEFKQPGQQPSDLLETTKDITMFDHPASERLPMFHRVLVRQLTDMMIADIKPGVWNQLDCRPPQNVIAHAIRDLVPAAQLAFAALCLITGAGAVPLLLAFLIYTLIKQETPFDTIYRVPDEEEKLPAGVAKYFPVKYERDGDPHALEPPAISFKKVLDIGVGTVHHHQQYQRITGCEMQANLDVPLYAESYSFFNGPLTDGDGYCDGTINYYALVDNGPSFALLFLDEQSYFSRRWRLVDPDDKAGAMFSLINDLTSQPAYQWEPQKYWSPFHSPQHINDQSRLAVSAQVLLVTGRDPVENKWKIYSINFSWGTMDRTWRWRYLPTGRDGAVDFFSQADVNAGNEPIRETGTTVYPQTIRLRDDLTITLKGVRNNTKGRWYQRYLPPDNALIPHREDLISGRQIPSQHFDHAWKFLPEPVFQLADKFQFFGAYDEAIDTRTQYYDVHVTAATEVTLLEGAEMPEPWIDEAHQLFISQWKFNWHDPGRLGIVPIDSPSTYYPDTRLRIQKKGTRWIATFWDKRDDDLKPFESLPKLVTLKKHTADGRTLTAQVTIGANHSLMRETQTPVVRNAYFWREPNGMAGVAFEGMSPDAVRENVSKVRMASLTAVSAPVPGDQDRVIPQVHSFLSQPAEGSFTPLIGNTFEFRWMPSAADRTMLDQHATPDGEQQFATSIWFEDIMGNVAPPERIIWNRSPVARAVATPSVISLGVPTQVTVHATDLRRGTAITGKVWVDDQQVGVTDQPFTFTFNSRIETETDWESHPPKVTTTVTNPVVTVTFDDYPTAIVPIEFVQPKLKLRFEPVSLPIGPTVQVVVRAEDETTHAPVQGRVFIAGVDVGATNTPFNFAFSVNPTSGEVRATGYPNKTFIVPLYAPTMQVSVTPSTIPTGLPVQVTVRAVDTRTGQLVNGRVKINGTDVGATNTPFTFTFGLTAPPAVVSAQFYSDTAIVWPPLSISTLTTSITPMPIPINKSTQCKVTAEDAQTGVRIAGKVKINGNEVAATNTTFTTTFRPKVVGSEGEQVMPEVSVSAVGYRNTIVNTGF